MRIWQPLPLHIVIIEILQRKGASIDDDLLKEIKKSYGDISTREFYDALMRLELQGLIRVYKLTKGKCKIELIKEED